jgi:hypothetical protein
MATEVDSNAVPKNIPVMIIYVQIKTPFDAVPF